ncbi:hypothetical protein INR49_022634 [Caranx melampygus]|nr:hypothetical protein INR49_022634 [Caranx melampygus]
MESLKYQYLSLPRAPVIAVGVVVCRCRHVPSQTAGMLLRSDRGPEAVEPRRLQPVTGHRSRVTERGRRPSRGAARGLRAGLRSFLVQEPQAADLTCLL